MKNLSWDMMSLGQD